MVLPYRVRQTAATPGTGDITLTGTDTDLYRSFVNHFGAFSNLINYVLVGPDTDKFFEVGAANFNGATNILSRSSDDQVLFSSSSNARVNIPVGVTYDVFLLDSASHNPKYISATTTLNKYNVGNVVVVGATTADITVTLPPGGHAALGVSIKIENKGNYNVTINAPGGESVQPSGAVLLYPTDSAHFFGMFGQWWSTIYREHSTLFIHGSGTVKRRTQRVVYLATNPGTSGYENGDIWFQP